VVCFGPALQGPVPHLNEGVAILERERERQELLAALRAAQDEHGCVALIEGPAGIGKSTLLWAALSEASGLGFTCLRARASELERDFPYGCMRQLLEPAIVKVGQPERERLFEDAAALSMPLFVHAGATAPRAPAQADSADGAFAMLHGLYWLLNKLARDQALLLCIDDLQWSDAETLRFLAYLAPRMDGLPLVVLASVRSRENVTADLARLSAAPETKVLRPAPLSVSATALLCERDLGTKVEPDFAAACHGATGGNPFFLQILLREAKELRFLTQASEAARVRRIGPAAVARAVLLRLSTAPPSAAALVRAIAVLGEGASVVDAARLAGLSEDEAARAADLLAGLAILQPTRSLEFAHPIVRHAIYEDIGTHERARAHARAALLLAERGADDERIAAQMVKAEPVGDPARVELLRRVAGRALTQGAPAAAVVWLARALAEPPPPASRPEVLLELGSAELRAGVPGAGAHLTAAVAEIRQPAQRAIGARQLANALSMEGKADEAVAVLEAAIAAIESDARGSSADDREQALILEAELAAKSQQAGHDARVKAQQRLARHGGLAGTTAGERLVLACLAFEHARAGATEREAVQLIESALARGGLLGQVPDVVGPFYTLVICLLATDALDLGRSHLDRALAEARARSSIPATAFLTVHRGWFFLRAGAVDQAEADARTALELLTAHDIELGQRFALALLVEALVENGQSDAAQEALSSGGADSEIPPGLASNELVQARGLLRLARGDARGALDDFTDFARRDVLWGAANPVATRWRSHACLALRALGEHEAARRMAAEDVELARRWGAASGIGMALRAAALVDEDAASIDKLVEAVSILERSPARLEHARALTDLGAAQRRANRRAEARAALEEGLKIARRCTAGGLADRAATELRAAGGRSSDPTGSALEQLTVSERRVAELAARGLNNPRIAQTLFVTRKTVETHLGRVYSKLGIAGRAQLAQALNQPPDS